MVTTGTGGNSFVHRCYHSKNQEELQAVYDEWATQYDHDLTSAAQDYQAPFYTAQAIAAAGGKIDGVVLDAGCGTGLSGLALQQVGAKTIDGLDLSPGMLDVARKTGLYRDLAVADLNKKIDKVDETYDVVACVGTLTHGHVGPSPALSEFARVLKKGGVFAGSVLEDLWSDGGFDAEVRRLEVDGVIEVVGTELVDYRKGAGVKAVNLVMRRK